MPSNIAYIPLSNGGLAVVDLDDVPTLLGVGWYRHPGGYASGRIGGRTRYMHRVLFGEPGFSIDHADRDKLNNRRSNLRAVTRSQNQYNMSVHRDNKSGFKGVCWNKKDKAWRSVCNRKHLGSFDDKYDAATAYNFAAAELHGEFAVYNTVPQPWLESL